MIEILVVAGGVASAAGWGSLAWWTSVRHHGQRAELLASRVVGCHPRGPRSAVTATWRTAGGPRSEARVIRGEIVAESTSAPSAPGGPRAAESGPSCLGRTVLHEDGSTTCHGGLYGCVGAGPHRAAPVACRSVSPDCDSCQLATGGVS